MKKYFANTGLYYHYLQALIIFFLDKRLKRDPRVIDRIQHMKAMSAVAELSLQDPRRSKALPADQSEQLRMMSRALPMLEQAVKKNPELTMSRLNEIAQNPQQVQTRVRTRPGPPMKGRRRY